MCRLWWGEWGGVGRGKKKGGGVEGEKLRWREWRALGVWRLCTGIGSNG